jgi:sigma-54 dependent transcriptional regulator, acetoin dehydrogenase operon transcriptional activator AcoR
MVAGTSDPDPRLRDSLQGILSGSGLIVDVRQEILSSWQRAAAAGATPEALHPPYSGDVELETRLERAAAPVIDHLATDLAGTETSLVLSDDRGTVTSRRVFSRHLESALDRVMLAPRFSFKEEQVGTNGIGTALVDRSPIFVRGGEHFTDAFIQTACAGAPITDPRNGEVLGVIDLSTFLTEAHALMLPLIKRAASDIEQRLIQDSPVIERLLYQHFLQARRRVKQPLVLVSEHTMLTNTAASRLLRPADREVLWEWALRVMTTSGSPGSEVQLTNGLTAVAECEPVYDAHLVIGAVIRLRIATSSGGSVVSGPSDQGTSPSGWGSLTEAERSVAELVAQGFTNREAAARLFLSWHTVDTHLRHIYAKLGITSRVQLARLVLEYANAGFDG